MLTKRIIESYIRWSGIDVDGRKQIAFFVGSRSALRVYANDNNIILLSTKREFHIKQHANAARVIYTFTKDLASILNTGINLMDALQLLRYRLKDHTLSHVLETIITRLFSGQDLSTALAAYPHLFSTAYIQLIKAAEMTQQLPAILARLAQQYEFTSSIRKKLTQALIYPTCVLLFTVLITTGLIAFAIPQFQTIFTNFNATLPTSTHIILSIGKYVQHYKLSIGLSISGLICLILMLYKKLHFAKRIVQSILIHTPWIGMLYRNKLIANWSYILGLCLQSNLSLKHALTLANDTLSNLKIKQSCQNIIVLLQSGHALHDALATCSLFSLSDLYLIKTGETSNTLEAALQRLSTQAFSDIENTLDTLSKWLEPVMMLVLAIIAGGLIISLYLPIFKIGAII